MYKYSDHISRRIQSQLGYFKSYGLLFFGVILVLSTIGCSSIGVDSTKTDVPGSLKLDSGLGLFVVSTTFDSEGRLWRLVPTDKFIYVDYSTDLGKSFSKPIAVNKQPQRIRIDAEDRASIVVDTKDKIYVTYFVGGLQSHQVYFSHSLGVATHFSTPVPLAGHKESANRYQDILGVSPSGRAYLFWNELNDPEQPGASLYFASTNDMDVWDSPRSKIKDGMCECCRIALSFDNKGFPVLFARFIFPGTIRDHGLVRMTSSGSVSTWRATFDNWQLDACPEHGPALAISENGRYHIAWFTQGRDQQGLYYAFSDDQGKNFSEPLAFGNKRNLAGHADVLVLKNRVVLVWKEFDGKNTQIMVQQSLDGGSNWLAASAIAMSRSASDHPFLKSNHKDIFLSWISQDQGYQLIQIK